MGKAVEKNPASKRSVLPWLKTLFRQRGVWWRARSRGWEQGEPASCIEDGLYSLRFLGTLASEGENTYKSAAIDLVSQTNLYVCYTKRLLTSLRLEAEGGGEIPPPQGGSS